MGEEDEETGERRQRPRGGDDLDDDFMEEDEEEGWAGTVTRFRIAGTPRASDDDGDCKYFRFLTSLLRFYMGTNRNRNKPSGTVLYCISSRNSGFLYGRSLLL